MNFLKAHYIFYLLTWLILPQLVSAQTIHSVPVQVTATFESSIFLDKGTADGIEAGQPTLIETSDGSVSAVIRAVSERESRCEVKRPRAGVKVGSMGVVHVASTMLKRLPALDEEQEIGLLQNEARVGNVTYERSRAGGLSRFAVQVTSSSGGSSYLDRGRAALLEPGDEVVLYPPGEGIVHATIQSVSKTSARCTIVSGPARVDVGTRGEVLIPEDRMPSDGDRTRSTGRQIPDHPPWTQASSEWDQSQPLLAPAYSLSAIERDPAMRGRLFANYLHSWNRTAGHDQYFLARMGTSMWIDNPLRRGGSLHLNGEFNHRGVLLNDFDDVDLPGRLDRISYSLGGTEEQPLRFEFGRFLAYEFPEFGIIDGAEVGYRTESGIRVGVAAGLLPIPFPTLRSRNDFSVAAYCRLFGRPDDVFSTGVGYQKSWHKGSPARDMLIYTADYYPHPRLFAHGTVWSDFYDSRDDLKSTRFEITQAVANITYRFNLKHGVGGHLSHVRWPQLLRREFRPFLDEQIEDGRTFRYGIHSWYEVGPRVRLDGRVDHWSDQSDDHGTSWEGRVSLRDFVMSQSALTIAAYGTDGIYSSGPGGRIGVFRYLSRCAVSAVYDVSNYQLVGASSRFMQHYVRGSLDVTLKSGKQVTLFNDYRFGNGQKAFQLGMFLQKRL